MPPREDAPSGGAGDLVACQCRCLEGGPRSPASGLRLLGSRVVGCSRPCGTGLQPVQDLFTFRAATAMERGHPVRSTIHVCRRPPAPPVRAGAHRPNRPTINPPAREPCCESLSALGGSRLQLVQEYVRVMERFMVEPRPPAPPARARAHRRNQFCGARPRACHSRPQWLPLNSVRAGPAPKSGID